METFVTLKHDKRFNAAVCLAGRATPALPKDVAKCALWALPVMQSQGNAHLLARLRSVVAK
jgi:hypothetical protein